MTVSARSQSGLIGRHWGSSVHERQWRTRRPQLTSAAGAVLEAAAGVVRREVVILLAAVRKRLAAVVVGPEAADNIRHPASNADRRGRGDNREGRRKAARTKRARPQPKRA